MISPAALVLRQLKDAERRGRRLAASRGPEALHDFRVALRRLETYLRAFSAPLAEVGARGLHRRFRRLAESTNASRDAEVFLAMLARYAAFPAAARRLRSRLERERLRILRRTLPEFFAAAETAQTRLQGAPRSRQAAGELLPKLLRHQLRRLRKNMSRARSLADQDRLHKARIAAKHLRYLLEPCRSALPAGPHLLRRVKKLQDLLGELHDALGLEAVLSRSRARTDPDRDILTDLRRRELKLFGRFRRQRLGKRELKA